MRTALSLATAAVWIAALSGAPVAAQKKDKKPDDETAILGNAFDPTFRDNAPEGGLLVGFQIGLGRFVKDDIIVAVRPIYRTKQGDGFGKQHGANMNRMVSVKAKPGYAIGGITAKAALSVHGFKITFMKVNKDGTLDPTDTYDSDWIGGVGGGKETVLGGDGTRIIGIVGKKDKNDCTGLGLLLDKPAAKKPDPK